MAGDGNYPFNSAWNRGTNQLVKSASYGTGQTRSVVFSNWFFDEQPVQATNVVLMVIANF